MPQQLERAQATDAEHPWPSLDQQGRPSGHQASPHDQVAHGFDFDSRIERVSTGARHRFGTPPQEMRIAVFARERQPAAQGGAPGMFPAVLDRDPAGRREAGELEVMVADALHDRPQLLQVCDASALVVAFGESLREREPAQHLEVGAAGLDRHPQRRALAVQRAHQILAQHRLPGPEVVI